MEKSLFILLGLSINLTSFSQVSPDRLRYFGYTAIDCFYDDPLDPSNTTNYVTEVNSFSNIGHMCVYDYSDNIVSRVNFMNDNCMQPLLHVQNVLFEIVDTLAPSGANYNLFPDYIARWNTFKLNNASVLSENKIATFYIADEPYWSGITSSEMQLVSTLLETDFPEIPTMFIEAYHILNSMVIAPEIDWVGFDMYGIHDPQNDPFFQAHMDTLKMKISSNHQRIFLIPDAQWFPEYESVLGWTQNEMANVLQNYYNLAISDSLIIGMVPYIWPGGLDGPTHHGVRNLTNNVISKNIEIGQAISLNFNPCNLSMNDEISKNDFQLFPNPIQNYFTVVFPENLFFEKLIVKNTQGQTIFEEKTPNSNTFTVSCENLSPGLYFIEVSNEKTTLSQKIIVE